MGMMSYCRGAVFVVMVALAGAGCQISKSSNPLSPAIAGPIAGVNISTPNLLEPDQDWQLRPRDQPLQLMIQNADSNGQRPLSYVFEIASDAEFTNIVFARTGVEPGGDGFTRLQLPDMLAAGTYWWRTRAEDGANTGPYSTVKSFTVLAPVVLAPPVPSVPANGSTISTTVPEFKIRAGDRSGITHEIEYIVHVSDNSAFTSIIAVWTKKETWPETTFATGHGFPYDGTYYWRVQAWHTADPADRSSWSATQMFRTPAAPAPEPAPPPPSGGGGGTGPSGPCGPPYQSDALGIMNCHRNNYPLHMSDSQAVSFLKLSARDFNRAGVGGGPWGVLQKRHGNNCLGYSCDIICAGQGSSQRQYDVLLDETYVQWGAPIPVIRVDVCEIQ